jgi:spore maturation protein CgeB
VRVLPGIPTIRPFEALACGIPLVCSPWDDAENLFGRGDFLRASDGREMTRRLETLLGSSSLRSRLAERGLKTIRRRHTCAHRADELMDIHATIMERRRALRARRKVVRFPIPRLAIPNLA